MITMTPDHKNKKVLVTVDNAIPRHRKGLREGLTEIRKENVSHARQLIKKPPKTGRIYRFRGAPHRASAPGQPPANRSGKLMRSVGGRVYGWEKMEFGDKAPYGVWLEDGTKKMKPRPHIKRTVNEKSRDNFNSLLTAVDKRVNTL